MYVILGIYLALLAYVAYDDLKDAHHEATFHKA